MNRIGRLWRRLALGKILQLGALTAFWLVLIFAACAAAAYVGATFPFTASLAQIQPWSFALGQVAFGVVAAFLAVILPNMSEFRHWRDIWRERVFDRELKVGDSMIEALKVLVDRPKLSRRITEQDRTRLTDWLAKLPESGPAERAAGYRRLASILRRVLEHEEVWTQLLIEESLSDHHEIGNGSMFREQAIAHSTYYDIVVQYRRLRLATILLCVVTGGVGILSLSPDPFFYGILDFYWSNMNSDFNEQQYRMLALVLPAIVALLSMAALGWIVGRTYGDLRLLDPNRFGAAQWVI